MDLINALTVNTIQDNIVRYRVVEKGYSSFTIVNVKGEEIVTIRNMKHEIVKSIASILNSTYNVGRFHGLKESVVAVKKFYGANGDPVPSVSPGNCKDPNFVGPKALPKLTLQELKNDDLNF